MLQQPGFDPENPDKEGPVGFIDYEYGAYTYRGFDIGNHFTEYAGFEGDYSRYVVMVGSVEQRLAVACGSDSGCRALG